MADTGEGEPRQSVTMELYRELRFGESAAFTRAAEAAGLEAAEAAAHRAELARLGLIEEAPGDDAVAVVGPEVALRRLIRREQQALRARERESADAHAAIGELAEHYLRSGVAPPVDRSVEVETEVATDRKRMKQILVEMNAGLVEWEGSMHHLPLKGPLEPGLQRDAESVARGVRVRELYSRRLTRVPSMAEHFARQQDVGVEVRTAPAVPITMIIGDGHTVLLPIDPENPRVGMLVVRAPALVRSYVALYEYCWLTATPYTRDDPGGEAEIWARLTEQHLTAVRMLAGGAKDERIARALGVSLRTVSRILSELMQELGASSRFEAGVRAARLGLLDPDGSQPEERA
ncbi:helix-turn-helix transcriptional regulator [Streptomyces sp. NPDC051940]|uniref:helix-turn-helix transcriptional regulator n=1 Tax=Streptomyces sp. NPDC051940 TaxID=3155675 RepID=UPI00342A767F